MFRDFSAERLAFVSARARARLHLHKDAVYPVFPGRQPRARCTVNCVSFVGYMCCVHVTHTRLHLHLYFASRNGARAEWTGAVKLKRNHREFLRGGEEGGWLSREDLLSFPRRRGTAVIGGTFLSKCSFLSRHSREHEGPIAQPSIASPGSRATERRQPLYGNFMLSLATGIHKTSRNTKHKANTRDVGSNGEIW